MHPKCIIIYLESFKLPLILQSQLLQVLNLLCPNIELFLALMLDCNPPFQNSILSQNYC